MKKIAVIIAAGTTVFGAHIASAQTYSPAGSYVYRGNVSVQKDLGVYNCVLTLNVTVPSSGAPTATGALSAGDAICGAIAVNNTGTVSYTDRLAPLSNRLTITGLEIVPAISFGKCIGPITADWGGNLPVPRTIILSVPLSNSAPTMGAACKMQGTLSQISGPGNLTITPDT